MISFDDKYENCRICGTYIPSDKWYLRQLGLCIGHFMGHDNPEAEKIKTDAWKRESENRERAFY